MASTSDEGRILLYYQQTKREHQYLKKKTEQFTESLRKVEAMYEATQDHELRMNDMDMKLAALAKDDETLKESFRKMSSDNHARFDKTSLELQGLWRKVLRLEALEKEHGTRVHNNGTILRDIQHKLAQLDNAVDDLSKSKSKITKRSDHPEISRLAKELESLHGLVNDQNESLQTLMKDIDEARQVVHQAGKGVSRATANLEQPDTRPIPEPEGTIQPQTPTPTAARKPVGRSQKVHSARLSKRHTIVSPRGAKRQSQRYTTTGPAQTPSRALNKVAKGLSSSSAQPSSYANSPISKRHQVPSERSFFNAATRKLERLTTKKTAQAPSQSQMDAILSSDGNAAIAHPSSQMSLMLHMNQSYPHIPGLARSSETNDMMGFRPDPDQRGRSTLTSQKQDQGYHNGPAENPAQQEQRHRKPPMLVPQPPKRKKRELPPMKPLPPYEE